MFFWPYRFSNRYWFNDPSIFAVYWAKTDTTWAYKRQPYIGPDGANIPVDPNKWSTVFYHTYYQFEDDYNSQTEDVLTRASEDVRNYAGGAFSAFQATYVVVVTWVRLYPFRGYDIGSPPRAENLYFSEVRI